MEFRFKIQPYQTAAAAAVTDVFEGQRKIEAYTYMRDLGRSVNKAKDTKSFNVDSFVIEEGYGNARVELKNYELLQNIRRIQARNQIMESDALHEGFGACQLDVEMETGTGKTYVYTKTIFELNKLYGWSKFIIVVPSVAIREGVNKSLQTTEQHFFEQYGKAIKYFIYDSDRLNEIDNFSKSNDINVMIINMQAFNSSMKDGGSSAAARKINSEQESFQYRRPIDVIAANNPIVIVDEPQKMGKKNGATWTGIKRFNPLFVLNYSATYHENNQVYALDPVDAFNEKLVKRIEVKGFELHNMKGTDGYLFLKEIIVSKNKAPEALIEYKAMSTSGKIVIKTGRFNELDNIYEATGDTRLEAYKDFVIAPGGIIPDIDDRIGEVRFMNDVVLKRGDIFGDSAGNDMRRVQIRATIDSHLQKEEALFYRGIKCLSLFFIDEVAKYRDITGNGETVGYGKIFEEEYKQAVKVRLSNYNLNDEQDMRYSEYLKRDSPDIIHDGYFSVDKNNKTVECSAKESKSEFGASDEDAKRGYDLILKNKERLLSFDEPVRFIFSHSALREGWDNPNIFQICTLKTSSSETGKRQEVGRGLRLCVDQEGERQDALYLGNRDVHNVNVLTVIASESYESFVNDLQDGIKKELRTRPTIVNESFFENKQVTLPQTGEVVVFDVKESKILYACLIKGDFIDLEGKPTEKFENGEFFAYAIVNLPEELRDDFKIQAAELLVRSVYDASVLDKMISDGNVVKVTKNALNDNFYRKEFQELWKLINHKHAYTVSFESEELIRHAVDSLNSKLEVSKLAYTITTGSQKKEATEEDIIDKTHFKTINTETQVLEIDSQINVTYDLVGEIAQASKITRKTAAEILSKINPLRYSLFKQNPEEFIKKVANIIVDEKASTIINHIRYHQIEGKGGEFDTTIFTERMPESMAKALKAEKNIQDYVFFDSDIEKNLAMDMDVAQEVCVYAKMPRTFKIPTPVGDYAPDWAIVFNEGDIKHVYFIAETKGSMNTFDLRPVESAKIKCAEKVFNDLSTSKVRYHRVTSYKDLLDAVRGN